MCSEPLTSSPLPASCKAKEGRGRSGEWGKLRPSEPGFCMRPSDYSQGGGRLTRGPGLLRPHGLPVPEEPRPDGGISHVGQGEGAWPPPFWIPVLPWTLTSIRGGD